MVENDLEGHRLPKIDSEMKQPWEPHQHSAAGTCWPQAAGLGLGHILLLTVALDQDYNCTPTSRWGVSSGALTPCARCYEAGRRHRHQSSGLSPLFLSVPCTELSAKGRKCSSPFSHPQERAQKCRLLLVVKGGGGLIVSFSCLEIPHFFGGGFHEGVSVGQLCLHTQ